LLVSDEAEFGDGGFQVQPRGGLGQVWPVEDVQTVPSDSAAAQAATDFVVGAGRVIASS
jgi:hypothetical protein